MLEPQGHSPIPDELGYLFDTIGFIADNFILLVVGAVVLYGVYKWTRRR